MLVRMYEKTLLGEWGLRAGGSIVAPGYAWGFESQAHGHPALMPPLRGQRTAPGGAGWEALPIR